MNPIDMVVAVSGFRDPEKSTFDHLAEEVMELHLAMRGKHGDTPAMEWLEIASLATVAFIGLPVTEQQKAYDDWMSRHGQRKEPQ